MKFFKFAKIFIRIVWAVFNILWNSRGSRLADGSLQARVLERLDGLLEMDAHNISLILNSRIDKKIKDARNFITQAPEILEPFNFHVGNFDLEGYIGAKNGRMKVGSLKKLKDISVDVGNETVITVDMEAENVEISYYSGLLNFIGVSTEGQLRSLFPSVTLHMKYKIGEHNATCADIELDEFELDFSDVKVHVYYDQNESDVFSSWISSALVHLKQDIVVLLTSYQNDMLKQLSCS